MPRLTVETKEMYGRIQVNMMAKTMPEELGGQFERSKAELEDEAMDVLEKLSAFCIELSDKSEIFELQVIDIP